MNDQHKAILEIARMIYPTARTLHVQENLKWFNPNYVKIAPKGLYGTEYFSTVSLIIVDEKYQASTTYHSSPENLHDELTRKADALQKV